MTGENSSNTAADRNAGKECEALSVGFGIAYLGIKVSINAAK
jgi:hypothetical protein